MLRILLVVASADVKLAVEQAIGSDERMRLAGVAQSATEALEMARRLNPDLIMVEPRLRGLDGTEIVREIMVEAPAPVVMVTRTEGFDVKSLAVDALTAGALAIVPAPADAGKRNAEASVRDFLSSLVAMSEVKVVRRWRGRSRTSGEPIEDRRNSIIGVIGIAASTGGPAAIKALLERLPFPFPTPILVVQHISRGFINTVASSLDRSLPLHVKAAEDGEVPLPGTVYLAPDDNQLGLDSRTRIRVAEDPPVDGFRPSGTYLFASMARVFGKESLAVVLTGMGKDGTEGLREIKGAGGMVIAQDEESSVVFGMPKAAINSGFVDRVLPLGEIPFEISRLAGLPLRS